MKQFKIENLNLLRVIPGSPCKAMVGTYIWKIDPINHHFVNFYKVTSYTHITVCNQFHLSQFLPLK